jgi:hypothetical protein
VAVPARTLPIGCPHDESLVDQLVARAMVVATDTFDDAAAGPSCASLPGDLDA